MTISQNGIQLIKQFEGLRTKAYKALPSEKYYTIGYGHYGPDVAHSMVITEYQAEVMLLADLPKYEYAVRKYENIYHWTQNQYDALVSFAYNLGPASIDQLTKNGTRTIKQIIDHIPLYCKSGGQIIRGLQLRRNTEKNLFRA